MLVGRIFVTVLRFCVKQEYLSIFHAYDIIYIKKRLLATDILIRDCIIHYSAVAVLVPPVDILRVLFQKLREIHFLIRCIP